MASKTRFNFQLDDELRKWLEQQADTYGVSIGSMINICISQYRDYMTFTRQFPDLMRMVSEQENKDKPFSEGTRGSL